MAQVSHETGRELTYPYGIVQLAVVDRETGRVAYSNLMLNIERTRFLRACEGAPIDPKGLEDQVGLSLRSVYNTRRGVPQTSVDDFTFHSIVRHFVRLSQVRELLPKCTADLQANPVWVEEVGDKTFSADWAEEVYRRIQQQ